MRKRGQLTVIIIIAVVIVVAIVGSLFIRGTLRQNPYDEKVSALRDNLLSCFEGNYEYALEVNSFRGGYHDESPKYYEADGFFVPYYYYEGGDYLPSLNTIENELGKTSRDLIRACVDYYSEQDNSFELSYDDYNVYAEIDERSVIFRTDMKINVAYDNKTVILDLSDSDVPVDSNLKTIYELSKMIVEQAKNSEYEWIGLTEIYDEALKRDLNVTIVDIIEEPNSYLFIIEENALNAYPTKFQFLNKYILKSVGFPTSFT